MSLVDAAGVRGVSRLDAEAAFSVMTLQCVLARHWSTPQFGASRRILLIYLISQIRRVAADGFLPA